MARAGAPPSRCSPRSPHCWGLPRSSTRRGLARSLVMGQEGEWTAEAGRREALAEAKGAGGPALGGGGVGGRQGEPVDAQAAGSGLSPVLGPLPLPLLGMVYRPC